MLAAYVAIQIALVEEKSWAFVIWTLQNVPIVLLFMDDSMMLEATFRLELSLANVAFRFGSRMFDMPMGYQQ